MDTGVSMAVVLEEQVDSEATLVDSFGILLWLCVNNLGYDCFQVLTFGFQDLSKINDNVF